MKPASGSLITLLNSSTEFLMADLLTVSLWDGSVLRLTSADSNIVLSGQTFTGGSDQDTGIPLFKRGKTRCVVGLEVDTLDVALLCGQTVQIGGIPMTLAAMNGLFDGARVKLERVFMPSWGDTSPGSVLLFEGGVAGVDPSSTRVGLKVKSELERLNVAMPHNLFMPSCGHVLYGPACGVVKASHTVTGSTLAGATTTSVPTNLSQVDDHFRLGVIAFTSGPCTGSRRAVRSYVDGTVVPSVPFLAAPQVGDAFTIFPGCDKTTGPQGCAKFANQLRNRSYPYVPRPETAR